MARTGHEGILTSATFFTTGSILRFALHPISTARFRGLTASGDSEFMHVTPTEHISTLAVLTSTYHIWAGTVGE